MSTYAPNLPAPPAPPKRKLPPWAWIVPAVAILMVLVGTNLGTDSGPSTIPGESDTPAVSDPIAPSTCIDLNASARESDAAAADFRSATDAANAGDAQGIITALSSAELHLMTVVSLTSDYPQVSEPMSSAATEVTQAKAAVIAGDYTTAGTHMNQAASYIDQATAAVNAGGIQSC